MIKDNEKHYEVRVDTNTKWLTINVFTESEDKKVIKEMAIKRAIEYMLEMGYVLGEDFTAEEMKPIGYKIKPQFVI